MNNQDVIKEFLTKIAKQDNRATAAPYFYVIRTEVERQAPVENCEYTKLYWDGDEYDSKEDIVESLEGCSEEYIETALYEATEYGISKEWVEKGMFLTEDDAKEHLRRNHYHYSSNAHTYVKHAWRAPELESFFKALFLEYKIDTGNLDLRMDK